MSTAQVAAANVFGDDMMSAVPRPAVDHAPLWSPTFEHDACGVGLVVDIAGKPSHDILERALADWSTSRTGAVSAPTPVPETGQASSLRSRLRSSMIISLLLGKVTLRRTSSE